MNIEENKALKGHTTFKIGGNSRYFCSVESEKDLLDALDFAGRKNLPVFVLGGGSNILVSDEGFVGLVIQMKMKGIAYEKDGDKAIVTAEAGESWDDLVRDVIAHGLYGLENLSGIPGTVGAAPVQNIGAYGSEVKDTVIKVRVYDPKDKKFRDLTNIECGFAYRTSVFKKAKYKHLIITSVSFLLSEKGSVHIGYKDLTNHFEKKNEKNPSLRDVRDAVIEIRRGKFPDLSKIGTAGSFWKNPIIEKKHYEKLVAEFPLMPSFPAEGGKVKVPLAWILDNVCGFKGFTRDKVGLWKNQALVLVNLSEARAQEIRTFAEDVRQAVFDKTGISIEPEVEYVPN